MTTGRRRQKLQYTTSEHDTKPLRERRNRTYIDLMRVLYFNDCICQLTLSSFFLLNLRSIKDCELKSSKDETKFLME